jgi:hypothetical protein
MARKWAVAEIMALLMCAGSEAIFGLAAMKLPGTLGSVSSTGAFTLLMASTDGFTGGLSSLTSATALLATGERDCSDVVLLALSRLPVLDNNL